MDGLIHSFRAAMEDGDMSTWGAAAVHVVLLQQLKLMTASFGEPVGEPLLTGKENSVNNVQDTRSVPGRHVSNK